MGTLRTIQSVGYLYSYVHSPSSADLPFLEVYSGKSFLNA